MEIETNPHSQLENPNISTEWMNLLEFFAYLVLLELLFHFE